MKNLFLFILFTSMSFIVGCSNTDSGTNNNGGNTFSSPYYPSKAGNYWRYKTFDSTSTHEVIGTMQYNGNTYYQVRNYSDGDTSAIRFDGVAVYSLVPTATGTLMEVATIKEGVGTTWSYDISDLFSDIHMVFTTEASGLTKVINGATFTDVLKVHSVTTGTLFGFSANDSTDQYYAKGVGLILDSSLTDDTNVESLLEYHLN